MSPSTDTVHPPGLTAVRVFVPISRWSAALWIQTAIRNLLGALTLGAIAYTTWIGIQSRRWDISLALITLLPWWWLFGAHVCWLLQSIRRGGHPLVLLIAEHGMALGMNDDGTLVRAFDEPSLHETADELIIENRSYYMVARLPKDQVSPEHAELIRQRTAHLGQGNPPPSLAGAQARSNA